MRIPLVALAALALGAAPALAQTTPFPFEGHAKAYKTFLASLPPPARNLAWLTKFDGPSSPARPLKLGGKPVSYVFGCKTHDCEANSANIFIMPDGAVRTVLKIKGAQTLAGGAGAAELACVKTLDASGGAAEVC